MTDVFDCVSVYVRRICGDEVVCVHLDDAEECQLRKHPNYGKFRSRAVAERLARKSSRLWESMVAMGRVSDMRGENKWRMIVMDCLTPFLGSRSRLIARDFHCDLGDVRSNMFEAALDVWEETAEGVPPREVPTLMVKAAISAAYRGADVHEHESSVGEVETFLPFEESALSSVIKASSIVYGADPRDPVVVEQIRGERMGALWQRFGLGEVINRHHAGLGDGSRPGLRSSLATEAMLTRTFVTGSNRYYYASDLYPKFVDLPAAAKALGIARTTAYRMVRTGSFPCPTTYMGRSHQVPTKALMHSMSIADSIVHADDVENGAAHACGT